ncbi:putative FAD dependent oxidoreductase [Lyophyllum shimeji]|uniref:FAD dependent oxidoreductase n=1 Tax=Lyophyllum shimeji TaxID=47721 RepID=A0A9P3UU35_LYOSH|nr:putative FAD dependent oxidoreductase [Lyophyllum shimeji]
MASGISHFSSLCQILQSILPRNSHRSRSTRIIHIADDGPPVYLQKLVARFQALGGTVHRAFLDSLASALQFLPGGEEPLAIVNCTGLGSLKLKDVHDTDMYPIRGQVLVLNAPWITEGRTKQVGKLGGAEGGERTYVIPRRSGEVIIGGTREVDDWTTEPRPQTSLDIKRRALALYPELAPESAPCGRKSVPEDLDRIVLREVVGFRPARKTGLRLEREMTYLSSRMEHTRARYPFCTTSGIQVRDGRVAGDARRRW